jgi:hypothetical protein
MNKFIYKKTFTFLFILFLASCTSAKKSSEVPKIYVSSAQYKALNCTELVQESEKLRAVEAGLSQVVDGNYKNQKDIELVTWILFWPAAFALDEKRSDADALGKARGELDAIRDSMISKKCGSAAVQ